MVFSRLDVGIAGKLELRLNRFTGGRYPPVAQGCHNVEFEHIVQGQLPPSTLYEPCARYKMPSRWGKSHVAQRRCLFRPRPRWLQGPKRGRRCNICSISTLWRFLPCTRYLQGCGGARPLHNGGVPSTHGRLLQYLSVRVGTCCRGTVLGFAHSLVAGNPPCV